MPLDSPIQSDIGPVKRTQITLFKLWPGRLTSPHRLPPSLYPSTLPMVVTALNQERNHQSMEICYYVR